MFSLSSCTGYKNLPKIPEQVITIYSIKLGYCLTYCFLGIYRRIAEREEELEEERKRKQMLSNMTEEELVEFKRAEEEERNRRDIEFGKRFDGSGLVASI